MTLLDAMLATLGGVWAVISAPLAVLLYGATLTVAGLWVVIIGSEYIGNDPFWTRIPYWVIGLAILLLGISMFVWIHDSYSPFTWSKP